MSILKVYDIIDVLGEGTFGVVRLGRDKITGEKVAIKILEKQKIIARHDEERVRRELDIIRRVNHINIIKIIKIEEDKDNKYLIMEYCEKGELFNHIIESENLGELEAAYYYYQLINGLECIHNNDFVHRDIKPENLLINKDNILKIIDFGLSNYFDKTQLLKTPCGSPCYASPEMVTGKNYDGCLSDVWSSGIVLYAMLCGYLPFEDPNNDILYRKIYLCNVEYPDDMSEDALNLLERILVNKPEIRITIPEIKKHPFYLKGRARFELLHADLLKEVEIDYTTLKESKSKGDINREGERKTRNEKNKSKKNLEIIKNELNSVDKINMDKNDEIKNDNKQNKNIITKKYEKTVDKENEKEIITNFKEKINNNEIIKKIKESFENKESKEIKEKEENKKSKESRESKENKGYKENIENKGKKEIKENKEFKGNKEIKEIKEIIDNKEKKEIIENKESKRIKENKQNKENIENKENKNNNKNNNNEKIPLEKRNDKDKNKDNLNENKDNVVNILYPRNKRNNKNEIKYIYNQDDKKNIFNDSDRKVRETKSYVSYNISKSVNIDTNNRRKERYESKSNNKIIKINNNNNKELEKKENSEQRLDNKKRNNQRDNKVRVSFNIIDNNNTKNKSTIDSDIYNNNITKNIRSITSNNSRKKIYDSSTIIKDNPNQKHYHRYNHSQALTKNKENKENISTENASNISYKTYNNNFFVVGHERNDKIIKSEILDSRRKNNKKTETNISILKDSINVNKDNKNNGNSRTNIVVNKHLYVRTNLNDSEKKIRIQNI